MDPHEAIGRLTRALAELNEPSIDAQRIRELTLACADEKHRAFIEHGLAENNRSLIMHGIVGMLSHYEAELEKQTHEQRFETLTHTH